MKKMQKAGIFFMALAAAGPVLAGPPLSDRQIRRQAEEETKAITERCCGYAYAGNPQKSGSTCGMKLMRNGRARL